MTRRVISCLAALLLVASTAACGSAGVAPSVASTSARPSATASTPPASTPSPARTITMADSGQSIRLAVGDRFVLALGEDFDWTVAPVDESIIVALPDQAAVPGLQGRYEAVGRGTTILSATGDPPCRKVTPPCGAPSILFTVTLVT